jgi:hypothetical protein
MSKSLSAAVLGLALVTAPLGARAADAAPILVAANRCNSQTIDDASARVRDYDRNSPGRGTTALLQRLGAVADVIAVLNEEREILDSICSGDAQRAPLFAQIAATAAWALTMEADLAQRLKPPCPEAANAAPTVMLADAWLAMANVVNSQGGTVAPAFNDVIPKVQSRADAVGLTLPPWSQTSAYWRDQVGAKEKAAVAACPSPSPSPTPSP